VATELAFNKKDKNARAKDLTSRRIDLYAALRQLNEPLSFHKRVGKRTNWDLLMRDSERKEESQSVRKRLRDETTT